MLPPKIELALIFVNCSIESTEAFSLRFFIYCLHVVLISQIKIYLKVHSTVVNNLISEEKLIDEKKGFASYLKFKEFDSKKSLLIG